MSFGRQTHTASSPLVLQQARVSRPLVFSVLFFIFALAYLLPPYWALALGVWPKATLALSTFTLGLLWAYWGSGRLAFPCSLSRLWQFLVALLLLLALNGKTLMSGLPWRGDEDHHFVTVLKLIPIIGYGCLLFAAALGPVVVWSMRNDFKRHTRGLLKPVLLAQILLTALVIAGTAWMEPDWPDLARYPLFVTWLASIAPPFPMLFFSWPSEAAFRVIPVLSSVLLAWHLSSRLPREFPMMGKALYIFVLGSIPLVFYYSSILYLEMPAVLLMVIVCLNSDALIRSSPRELVQKPHWYALVLIGFVKENTIIFLIALLLCRLAFQLRNLWPTGNRWRAALGEARVAFCILLPIATYLCYRIFLVQDVGRSYWPDFSALSDLDTYNTLARAFWDQLGPIALLSPLGMALLAKKKVGTFSFLLVAFVIYAGFHVLDLEWVLAYSRYMLFFAPMVICASHQVILWVSKRSLKFVLLLLFVMASANLIMSPVNLDGSKKPGWGQYREDVSEHYYPYREAIHHILMQHPQDKCQLTGLSYRYLHQFYVRPADLPSHSLDPRPPGRFEWRRISREEWADADAVLLEAKETGCKHVIFQVLDGRVPSPRSATGFELNRVFRNSAHSVVLFSLKEKR